MGGGTHEATISMEFWEHERLNRPDLAKRSTISGNFYVADITDWDMIMGYDFMVGNAIGALPHRATLVREDNECLTWLSTDYACGSSQWNAEEEDRIIQAVQAVGAKSRGDRGVQLTEYRMAPQVLKRYGVLHPYPLPSLWRSSPGWLRNFPEDVTASRFLWDFCKIPQKSSFFVIFGLATTVVACATQPQIEDLFLNF